MSKTKKGTLKENPDMPAATQSLGMNCMEGKKADSRST